MKLYITTKLILNLLFLNITPSNEDNPNHIIRNDTKVEYLDEIVREGLRELGIGKVRIRIRPMDRWVKYSVESRTNQILEAFITGSGKHYTIYIGSFSKSKSTTILAHELIHLKQYYTRTLQLFENDLIYNDKIYHKPDQLDYYRRPWEADAYREGKKLRYSIEKRLEL
jgi:hypothetical protein